MDPDQRMAADRARNRAHHFYEYVKALAEEGMASQIELENAHREHMAHQRAFERRQREAYNRRVAGPGPAPPSPGTSDTNRPLHVPPPDPAKPQAPSAAAAATPKQTQPQKRALSPFPESTPHVPPKQQTLEDLAREEAAHGD